MAIGNKHLGYKEALNAIEATSPGSKFDFYFGFLARASEQFRPKVEADQGELEPCIRCGEPTPGEVCAFCKLVDRAGGHPQGAVPVALTRCAGRSGPVRRSCPRSEEHTSELQSL